MRAFQTSCILGHHSAAVRAGVTETGGGAAELSVAAAWPALCPMERLADSCEVLSYSRERILGVIVQSCLRGVDSGIGRLFVQFFSPKLLPDHGIFSLEFTSASVSTCKGDSCEGMDN